MHEFDSQIADQQAKTLNAILRENYGWQSENFIDGMAPLGYPYPGAKQSWSPKATLPERIRGVKLKRTVRFGKIIKSGVFLKFMMADVEELKANSPASIKDYTYWISYFTREATCEFLIDADHEDAPLLPFYERAYANNRDALILDRWMEFSKYDMSGFDLIVNSVDGHFRATIPAIVLCGAQWIKIVQPNYSL